jgi:hypothetical protein
MKMERNLNSLDLATLKALYEKEAEELSSALLNGCTWDETRDKRKNVTEISIALHQKRFPQNPHPAGNLGRNNSR